MTDCTQCNTNSPAFVCTEYSFPFLFFQLYSLIYKGDLFKQSTQLQETEGFDSHFVKVLHGSLAFKMSRIKLLSTAGSLRIFLCRRQFVSHIVYLMYLMFSSLCVLPKVKCCTEHNFPRVPLLTLLNKKNDICMYLGT